MGSPGSSPLARGLPGWWPPAWGSPRIIPARAGFTSTASCPSSHSRDHPRSRGVYPSRTCNDSRPAGSSPLARGLLPAVNLSHGVTGIIPARAGFTCMPSPAVSAGRGSSPLARGLPKSSTVAKVSARIIPARAGFTYRPPWGTRWPEDHPRSRGVYGDEARPGCGVRGSSPLARGLHQREAVP